MTWDEDDLAERQPHPDAGDRALGTRRDAGDDRLDHYAMLRATQEMLGVTPLLGAAAGAADLRKPFNL